MIPSDLQSIFRAQIAALWENVEGSQVNIYIYIYIPSGVSF